MPLDRIYTEIHQLAHTVFGIPEDELDPHAGILELGLDSLMIIKLGQEIERRFGVALEARWFLTAMPSLASLAEHIHGLVGNGNGNGNGSACAAKPCAAPASEQQPTAAISAPRPAEPRPASSAEATASAEAAASAALGALEGMTALWSGRSATPSSEGVLRANGNPDTGADARNADSLALFSAQLDAMQRLFARQLEALQAVLPGNGNSVEPQAAATGGRAALRQPVVHAEPESRPEQPKKPHMRGFVLEPTPLTAEQQGFVERLVASHVARTRRSRELGRKSPVLADWKSSLSYRPELRETAYPIVADAMKGGRFTDADGNEYIDIAVGMGVHFLGHNPPYVEEAIRRRLGRGFGLGPQCDITEEAAECIGRLTGAERVSFCNTGSEAVMFALRLARARTGKSTVAIFSGSYHGTFDGVLAAEEDGRPHPSSPGTPLGMVRDVLLLDYNSETAFAKLEERRDTLAAVLVEPVQSRRPGLQPQTFLRRLRRYTKEHGICLIFDEMVNGFRIAAGGAQAHFGIRADMALYGKIIGGGLPVGVVTGKREYLDHIDGGFLGDDSRLPSSDTIVFGGTFCRHPLSMEGVCATARHLEQQGDALYARANAMMDGLADRLNLWFQDNEVPLRLMHFGAQFIFESYGPYSAFAQPIELQLFYMLLLERGVYTWERRTCGISTEHDQADMARIGQAVRDSVTALREGGFPFRLKAGAPRLFGPMTPTQERLYAIFQREHGQAAYHLPLAWRVEGEVDAGLLEINLGEIIKRHEALRTGFHQLDGRLLQKIHPEPPFFLERVDARADEAVEEQIASFIRPFDLDKPPLLRARLARQPDGAHLFLLDVLHITADGASLGIILDELNRLMQGGNLTTKPIPFREAHASLAVEGRQADLDHWTERLTDCPLLELPLDRPTEAGSPRGEQHWMVIDADTLASAKAACKIYGVTLNMFLNGVYAIFLHGLTGGRRFCVGMADGGRFGPKAEQAVGMFVNTVPQEFRVEPAQALKEFFTGIRLSCADSMSRNHAPYGDIVRALGRSPAATMLSYERADHRKPVWPGLRITPVAAHGQGAMYDLAIDTVEMDGVLHCNLQHSMAYRPETVRSFGKVFAHLVRQAAGHTDALVGDLSFLPPAQYDRLKRDWAAAAGPFDRSVSVVEAVRRQVESTPEATALVQEHEGQSIRISYAELAARGDALARRLVALGAGPEKVVALLFDRTPAFVVAALGVLEAGAAYMPLAPDYPDERIQFQLRDSAAVAILTTRDMLPRASEYGLRCLTVGPDGQLDDQPGDRPEACPEAALPTPAPEQLAYIIYTSGTTGRPKGVMIEHHSLSNLCQWFVRHYGITDADRTTAFAPFVFDPSLWELFPMLSQGACIHILHEDVRRSLSAIHDYLRKHRITVAYFLSQVSELIEGDRLPDLRLLLSGGDVLHVASPRGAYRHSNAYGPTEFTITSHVTELDGTWPVSLGKPVHNIQCMVISARGQLMPIGFPGELCLAGEQIARGYLNRPEVTEKAFVPNPFAHDAPTAAGTDHSRMYRTGDLCRWRADGGYDFMGRKDEQVKIRGHRVELGEVGKAVTECPGVEQNTVQALVDEADRKYLCAYVVPTPGTDKAALEAALRDHLTRRLPPYMLPQCYVFMDRLPYASSGKLDRRALPKPEQSAAAYVPPATPEEEMLAQVWQEQLGCPRIGRNDNFFDLGGDSIKGLMLTAGVRARGYGMQARDLFKAPTLQALAALVRPLAGQGTGADSKPRAEGVAASGDKRSEPLAARINARPETVGSSPAAAAPSRLVHATVAKPGDASSAGAISSGVLPADTEAVRARYGNALEHIHLPSPLQEGMLFHHQMMRETQDAEVYREQTDLHIRGPLDADALEARFFRIIARHEAMRSVLAHSGVSRPLVAVLRAESMPKTCFAHMDLSTLPPREQELRIEADARGARAALRSVEQAPLARLALYKLGKSEHRLLFTIHHCVTDGWSNGVFFSELLGEREPDAGPATPFRAYIDWLGQQDAPSVRAWWRAYLEGVTERTVLPGHKPAPHAGYEGRQLDLPMSRELEERLRDVARRLHATMNSVLQTAWAVVLSRCNQHEDMVFGEVVSGRPPELPGMHEIMGLCSNMAPVRIRCPAGMKFSELVASVQERALAAQPHACWPLADIQARHELRGDLIGHFFVMENYPAPKGRADLAVAIRDGFSRTSYDFAVVWEQRDGALSGSFIYNGAAIPDWQVEALRDAYLTLLDGVSLAPEATLASFPLLSAAACEAMLRDFTPVAVEHPDRSVAELFVEMAARQPEATAVVCRGQRLSYGELDGRSTALAARLQEAGAGKERIVAVLLNRGTGFSLTCLAVLKAGAAFLPLDPETPPDRLRFILQDSAPVALVGDSAHLGSLPETLPVFDIQDERLYRDVPDFTPAKPARDDAAYVIYTSGTTGTPKGVIIRHAALTNQTLWTCRHYELSPRSVLTHFASHAFDVSLWETFPALLAGATLHVLDDELRHNPARLAAYVREQGVTDLWLPPHLASLYLREYEVAGLRSLTAGGDRFAPQAVRGGGADFFLYNNYGPTECAITATSHRFRPGEPVTIGRPVDNTPCYVLDRAGHVQPLGFPGELHIGGVQVGRGYLGRQELTERVFKPDPFRAGAVYGRMYATGDLCSLLPDGQIAFHGRLDQQVKVRGHRIELGEIEKVLGRHPAVGQCVATVKADAAGAVRLCAYVIARGARDTLSPDDLRAEAAKWLPAYMTPDVIMPLEAFPLSVTGKIDAKRLPSPPERTRSYAAPGTDPEKALAEVLADILNAPQVGLHDNFFDLGGDSIKALMLVARLEKLGYSLAMKDVFLPVDLEELARLMVPATVREASGAPRRGREAPEEDARTLRRRYAREGVERICGLTPMQEGMLFDIRSSGEAGSQRVYLIENHALIEGRLAPEELAARLDVLVSRHDALRTVFVDEGVSRPLQVVLRQKACIFRYEDIADLASHEQDAHIRDACAALAEEPLRLERDALFRVALFRLGRDRFHMALVWHHIILDGWSLGLLLQELFAPEVPDTPAVSFVDHVEWVERQDGDAHMDWWRRQLAGVESATGLPGDLPGERPSDASSPCADRPAAREGDEVAALPFTLDRQTDARLRALAAERRVTLNCVLQAAWALLLSRYNDVEEVVYAALTSGRSGGVPGAEAMVGLCIGTVPMRVACPFEEPFMHLAARVQSALLEAMEHSACSAAAMRSLVGANFADILFVMENQPAMQTEAGLAVTPGRSSGFTGLDLAVEWQDNGRLSATLHYNPARFAPWRMEALRDHYCMLLEQGARQPGAPSGSLAMLTPAEERRILKHGAPADREWQETTFPALFLAAAERHPDRIALADGVRAYTYAALRAKAETVARNLNHLGVARGDAVGVLMSRSADYAVAEIGIMLAGGAFVPLDPAYPAERLAAMIEDSGARLIVTDDAAEDGAPGSALGQAPARRSLSRLSASVNDAKQALPLPDAGDLAYILYTSGSTGRPKGVMIEHRGLANLCRWFRDDLGVTERDVFSVYAPFVFDASVYELFPALACAAAAQVAPEDIRTDEEALAAFFRDRAISVAFLPPLVGKALLAGRDFPALRLLTFAGDRPGVLEPQPFTLMNCYGPTEFTVCATCWPVAEPRVSPPIGTPIANAHCHVVDARMRLMPYGVPGELCLSGAQCARGYRNLPEQTAASFVPNPFGGEHPQHARMYRTGDRCRLMPDGMLEFLGRMDHQLKIRGQRIEPEEIEQVLRGHPEVSEAVVTPIRRGSTSSLHAYVTALKEAHPEALLAWLAERLPPWMQPSGLTRLEAMPLTRNGKIDKAALPVPVLVDEDEAGQATAARTEPERLLAAVWREVLGVADPDVNSSFFALGGDSIKAMQVASRLRAAGCLLTTRQIFSLQTIARLAAAMERAPVHGDAGRPEAAPPVKDIDPPQANRQAIERAFADHPRRIEDVFALTPMQESLLSHHVMHPESPAYTEQSRLDIHGPLDARALRENFEAAVRRHQALRSGFFWKGVARPYQVVFEEGLAAFSEHDLSSLSEQEQNTRLAADLAAIRADGFDLERGPLFRLSLYRLAPESHALLVTFHHGILDGWSMNLLAGELLGGGASQADAGLSLRSYAQWVADNDTETARAWWGEYLSGAQPTRLALRERGQDEPADVRDVVRGMDGVLPARLRALAVEREVTMNTLLQTAWGVVLARYADRDEAVFGAVLSGRSAPMDGVERMVGLFVQTVPVRIRCSDGLGLADLLRDAQDAALNAESRAHIPLEVILKATPHGASLLRHLFVFENLPAAAAPAGLRVAAGPGFNETPYDACLVLEHLPESQHLQARLQYNARVLPGWMAEGLLRHLEAVLGRMVDAPDARADDLRLLCGDEENAVLRASLADAVPGEAAATVVDMFASMAEANPQAKALVCGDKVWTYAELDRQSAILARALRARGAGPEAVVGVLLERSGECIVAMLGIARAGGAYLMLDPAYPVRRLSFMLEDAGARVLVTSEGCCPPDMAFDGLRLSMAEALADGGPREDAEQAQPRPSDAAYVVYTSGTTGQPKGIVVEHAALANFCRWHKHFYGLTAADAAGHVFSFSFDASGWGIFPMLAAGATIHVLTGDDRANPMRLREYFDVHGITLANIPTAFAERLFSLPAPSRLRLLASGGDALRSWKPQPYAVYNEYGPSEATIMATCHKVAEQDGVIPIGRAIAGCCCLVLDRNGRLQPFGAPGELHIAGPQLARGYLNRPQATQSAFIANPFASACPPQGPAYERMYRTGDLCRMLPSGELLFLGRMDQQLSVRGHRVEPAEIEQHLLSLPGVSAAVVAMHDEQGREPILCAYVVSNDSDEARWRAHLAERLPAYMAPGAFIRLEAIPLTANGKIDKAALPKPVFEGGRASAPACRAEELALARIWEDVLGIAQVGMDDDFFALGGDSIKAVRMAAMVEGLWGKRLPMAGLMGGITIRELAQRLAGQGEGWTPLVPLRKGAGTALVLVHSLGGSILCYRGLLEALPGDVPVFVLPPYGLEDGQTPAVDLCDMVEPYVEPLCRMFPDGDVVLLGLCMAGLTAWELACQMERRGCRVRHVVSLNTRSHLLLDEQGRAVPLAEIPEEAPEEAIDIGMETLAGYEGGARNGMEERLRAFIKAQLHAWAHYAPRPAPFAMTCIRPLEPVSDDYLPFETRPLGWEPLALGGAREVHCPGSHFTMLASPHVADMANIVEGILARGPAAGVRIPLTPIQEWFFGLPMRHGHFFQSVRLESPRVRPASAYRKALASLVARHDMLRACYMREEGGWAQRLALQGAFGFRMCPADDLDATQRHIAQTQDLLHSPPVWCLVGRDDASDAKGRQDIIVLMAHHLVIDGMSWRILLEDFSAALACLDQGREINLPSEALREDGSFAAWASRLRDYAASSALQADAAYWRGVVAALPPALPTRGTVARRLRGELDSLSMRVGKAATAALMRQSQALYGARSETVLLAALMEAVHGWRGLEAMTVMLEGHGREDLFDDVSLLSVVGWFTTMYPVVVRRADSPAETITGLQRQLDAIPGRGIGFGIAGRLGGQAELADCRADVLFNFLGEAAAPKSGGAPFSLGQIGSPWDVGDDFPQETPLAINCHVQDGALALTVDWHPHEFTHESIASLLKEYVRKLESMAADRQDAGA